MILTFPAVRRSLRRIIAKRGIGDVLLLLAQFLTVVPYATLRAEADGLRPAINGTRYEEALFGRLPTVTLQKALYSGHYGWLEHGAVYLHASWFFIPPAITLYVLIRYRPEFGSYFVWHALATYVAVIAFAVFPMAPPWMTNDQVTRIIALRWQSEASSDPNTFAAMPSFHVALPLVLAAWAYFHEHKRLATFAGVFAGLSAFNVVFLGEHYLIDVAGAGALALVVSCLGLAIERAPWRSFAVSLRPTVTAVRRGPAELGQAILEFALLTPIVIVLIAAIVTFGIALNARASLQQAVREGARQAAVGKSLSEVQNLAAGNATEQIDAADVKVCHPLGDGGSQGHVGDPVKVYIFKDGAKGYPFPLVPSNGIFSAFGVGTLTVRMSPEATTRLEKSVAAPVACP